MSYYQMFLLLGMYENSVCYTCHNYIHVFCYGIVDSIYCPYLEYTIWKLSYMYQSMETFVYCISTAVQTFLTMLAAKGRKGLFWLTDLGWVNDGGKAMAGAGWGWSYFMLSQEAERDESCDLVHSPPFYSIWDPHLTEWCHPQAGWGFLSVLNHSGNTLVA